jgi:transitional endoplasmic reticulum ATPase
MSEAGTSGEVRARVEGARKRDAGRGIARLPESLQSELGLLSGDPVVIEGDRETVAKVWPGSDEGVVRIDADTRTSAGATVGDTVRLRGASVKEAAAVTLRPTDEGEHDHDSGSGADGRQDLPSDGTAARRLRDRILAPGKRLRVDGEPFVVGETAPSGTVRVTNATAVTVDPEPATVDGTDETIDEEPTGTTYEDIGGLDEELDLVRETVELPLSEPETFAGLGVDPPSGVLLYGPPGTGKTLIARAVANEVDAYFDTISGPEVVSKYKGESEQRLRRAFEAAAENAPAVLFIDEIDSIAGARDEDADMENRVVAQLLTLMDGLDTDEGVVVVGATNRVDDVDPALRRGGRFDREIEVGVPDEAGRREVLTVHTRGMPLAADVDLDTVAARTHGFVGADLASLAREAAMSALRRDADREGPPDVTAADFERALAAVDPSAMREYVAESPEETFVDVGGLGDTKDRLREAVEWPLSYGPLFEAAGADPPSGVLLYGPPGTGKTLLARAVAGESGVNFLRVAGPELLDRYVGESEEAVREVFERARQTAPAVVFLDEVDAVAGRRGETGEVTDRVVSQLLTELDRAADHPSLLVLAATNRKDSLDPALLRPGRLERHVEVPPPDEAARREILAVHARETPLAADVDLDALAAETAGFSGAQLEALVRDASLRAVREVVETVEPEEAGEHTDRVTVTREHVDAALASLSASANSE